MPDGGAFIHTGKFYERGVIKKMTTKKATRRALFTSIMALVMCLVMLVGTTFAWFTDSVTSGVNTIKSGNLDMEVTYKTAKGGEQATGTLDRNTKLFNDAALWEPGHVEYAVLTVKNVGSLALKYTLGINIASETGSVNMLGDAFQLSSYLQYAVIEDNLGDSFDRDTLTGYPGSALANYTTADTPLLSGESKTVTLAIWMPTTVGNEANHAKGAAVPTIELGVSLMATQYEHETDSFGKDYDAAAGAEISVDTTNIQDYLDGKYGSIDGMTLVLAAGDYDKIEFGRATAYAGSNTKYYLGGTESSVDAIKQDIADHPNGGAGTREYVRSMSNVTLKAADGAAVTINGLVAFGGQVNSTKWYSRDFVADRDMSATVNNNISYWIGQKWSNITFEGLTFKDGVNIEAYGNKDTLIDNVKFDNCKFNIANNADAKYCIRLNVDGNIAKANNLVVTKCDFANGLTAVLTDGMPNVTVTDSTFSGLTRHAINPMMNELPNAPGYGKITVTGNTFKNMSTNAAKGTILRMGDVGAGTVFTIQNNTATEGITLANSIKVNSLADSITYNISGNNWGSLTASDSRLDG